jgi:hypothetical protein
MFAIAHFSRFIMVLAYIEQFVRTATPTITIDVALLA